MKLSKRDRFDALQVVNEGMKKYVQQKIAEAQISGGGGGGNIDLTDSYVSKVIGNADQITFSDGQTFQSKLDNGTLKGPKGDTGERGPQGSAGINGQDGLTTAVSVNGTTYTHVGGTITLPDYPTVPTRTSQLTNDSSFATESFVTEKIAEASLSSGEVDLSTYATIEYVNDFTGGKKQRYLTQAEYDVLSDEQKNDDSIVYNITNVNNDVNFAFNTDGDLEVTINGVTKVFTPKA